MVQVYRRGGDVVLSPGLAILSNLTRGDLGPRHNPADTAAYAVATNERISMMLDSASRVAPSEKSML